MARLITTTRGTIYVVSISGRKAYPKRDPDGKCRGNYNPRLDWGPDVAAACGLLVDATLDANDYRVRGAGPEWLEVYQALRSL